MVVNDGFLKESGENTRTSYPSLILLLISILKSNIFLNLPKVLRSSSFNSVNRDTNIRNTFLKQFITVH